MSHDGEFQWPPEVPVPTLPKIFDDPVADVEKRARCFCGTGCESQGIAAGIVTCSSHKKDWEVWCGTCQMPICIGELIKGGRCNGHETALFPKTFQEHERNGKFTAAFDGGKTFIEYLQKLRARAEPIFKNGVQEQIAKTLSEVKEWSKDRDAILIKIEYEAASELENKVFEENQLKQKQQIVVDDIKLQVSHKKDVEIPEVEARFSSRIKDLEEELAKVKMMIDAEQASKKAALEAEGKGLQGLEKNLKEAESALAEREQSWTRVRQEHVDMLQKVGVSIAQKQKEAEKEVDLIISKIHEMGRSSAMVWQSWLAETQKLERLVEAKVAETRKHCEVAPSADESAKFALISVHELVDLIRELVKNPLPAAPTAIPLVGFENVADVEVFQQIVEWFSSIYPVAFSRLNKEDSEGHKKREDQAADLRKRAEAVKKMYDAVSGKVFANWAFEEYCGRFWSNVSGSKSSSEPDLVFFLNSGAIWQPKRQIASPNSKASVDASENAQARRTRAFWFFSRTGADLGGS